ncbi:AAA family ATPase [Sphaerobacter thermophilus]|uniref:ATPase associated with various cellular activities AAA_3 n=1 Tax=Sphaerobacter thermophilus (strain ATCC 49802 / DSM 20745 / KCCM 41009 / NCIMB 13125 / S 6022) TaxID=479434 RepID=D1C9P1_SPHTD|nr:MoxR family ATPase [Sphaerobacter thermophilus]ACZ40534.1 ATPase associated with various cellular activities AAA_3 [Sphaerobacter thermophilus DSM 20745]
MESAARVADRPDEATLNAIRVTVDRLRAAVEQVIVGKRAVIDRLLVAILAEGHVLIEDVPGIGKTKLARSLSLALGGTFHRIQFTPDLLPSDVSGSLVFDQRSATFTFHPGPVFANVVLADEINRAGPRTQSALLEAMEERQVTVERQTYPLPRPFLVVATQNPVELEGTFPLPEAQLDRFFLSTAVGYPEREDERDMLRRFRVHDPLAEVQAVTSPEEITAMIGTVRRVYIGAAVEDYVLDIVRLTRSHDEIELGASPRAALALARAAQATAAMNGRGFVIPDDVRAMALPVLAHRIIPAARVELQGRTKEAILSDLIAQVPVPVEEETEA